MGRLSVVWRAVGGVCLVDLALLGLLYGGGDGGGGCFLGQRDLRSRELDWCGPLFYWIVLVNNLSKYGECAHVLPVGCDS